MLKRLLYEKAAQKMLMKLTPWQCFWNWCSRRWVDSRHTRVAKRSSLHVYSSHYTSHRTSDRRVRSWLCRWNWIDKRWSNFAKRKRSFVDKFRRIRNNWIRLLGPGRRRRFGKGRSVRLSDFRAKWRHSHSNRIVAENNINRGFQPFSFAYHEEYFLVSPPVEKHWIISYDFLKL